MQHFHATYPPNVSHSLSLSFPHLCAMALTLGQACYPISLRIATLLPFFFRKIARGYKLYDRACVRGYIRRDAPGAT